jgi:hypothetical protein
VPLLDINKLGTGWSKGVEEAPAVDPVTQNMIMITQHAWCLRLIVPHPPGVRASKCDSIKWQNNENTLLMYYIPSATAVLWNFLVSVFDMRLKKPSIGGACRSRSQHYWYLVTSLEEQHI